MPFCPSCNYWIRRSRVRLRSKCCPNCGNYPFLAKLSRYDRDERTGKPALWNRPDGLFLTALAGLACGVIGYHDNAFLAGMFSMVGILFAWRGLLMVKRLKVLAKSRLHSAQAMFGVLHLQQRDLKNHIKQLEELCRSEQDEIPSPRREQRLELICGVITNRQKKRCLIETELWARDIQLWMNQLEGFLSEKLAMLDRENGTLLLGEFRILILAGKQMLTKASRLAGDSPLGQKAEQLLTECLARAPEFEERVRDARVLAVVDTGADVPVELSEGRTWLHWIQDAIPTLGLLPDALLIDEEYHRMNAELRLLRDQPQQTPPIPQPALSG